ncbi:MAG: metallophosphoesterase [Clostridia bacterium]|nr:metallophosphoesterase [Clostridia bacterium]
MMKKVKKSLLVASLLASSFLACGAVYSSNTVKTNVANAGSEAVEAVDFGTVFGASVRISEPNGIRFKLQLSESKKTEIFAKDSGKTLGMFIFPGSKIDTTTDYSTLSQKINISFAENNLYKDGDYWYANGVMTNLYIQNFNKEFVGVGYIYDGTNYEYSEFTESENVRSLSYVAGEAYNNPNLSEYKDTIAGLIEKAVYAESGVTETRTEAQDGTITYSFTNGTNTWSSFAEMKASMPVSMSVATSEADLLVGESLNLDASLVVGNTAISTVDVPFEYSIDSNVITLENGVIKAVENGTANVTVSFGDYSKTVKVNVVSPQVVSYKTDGHPDINMYNATASLDLSTLKVDGVALGDIKGDVQSLTIDGTDLFSVGLTELEGNVLTLTSADHLVNDYGALRGQKTMVLKTNVYKNETLLEKVITYEIPVTMADYVFTKHSEYRNFADYLLPANKSTDTWNPRQSTAPTSTFGYFVLGDNLDFKTEQIASSGKRVALTSNSIDASGFKGTLDGQGYTISNGVFYGNSLVEYVRRGAVVKDIQIEGFNLNRYNYSAAIVAQYAGQGYTISNVYAKVNVTSKPSANANTVMYGLIGRQTPNGGGDSIVKDCVVLASVSGMTAVENERTGLFLGLNADGNGNLPGNCPITFENCVGIVTDTNDNGYKVSGNFGSQCTMSVITQKNCSFHASWADYNSNRAYGCNASMIDFIEKYNPTDFETEYLEVTTDGHPDINMYNKTASLDLTALTVDGVALGNMSGEVESLTIDGQDLLNIGNTTFSAGTLSFASDEHLVDDYGFLRGQKTIELVMHFYYGDYLAKQATYHIPVTMADYVFTKHSEYRNFADYVLPANTSTDNWNPGGVNSFKQTFGYFVLGKDLDFNNDQIAYSDKRVALTSNSIDASGFKGTLDGQGYTISNGTFYGNSLVLSMRRGAVVKDIQIENFNLNRYNYSASIVTQYAGQGYTISNVYAQVNVTSYAQNATDRYGLIGRQQATQGSCECIVKDCVVIASVLNMSKAESNRQGLFLGHNVDGNLNMPANTKITFENCIGIIMDTNANGYTVSSNFGSQCTMSVITQTNCGYYESFSQYNEVESTLTGYNSDMLAFIDKCNSTWISDREAVTDYAYSFAVVGDIQTLTRVYPEELDTVYGWILDNRESKNIQHVFNLGDITDWTDDEWNVAKEAISKMDGVISYSVIRGNHDSTAKINEYFFYDEYTNQFIGFFGENSMTNSYKSLSVSGVDYLLVTLDYGATDEELSWASEIIESYPNHRVIITTHAYMDADGSLLEAGETHAPKDEMDKDDAPEKVYNSGEDMWNELFSKHSNIFLVMCGHISSDDVVTVQTAGDNGNIVTQILIDPQTMDVASPKGMVAMLYFSNDGNTITVEYYSTVREQYFKESNQFTIDISSWNTQTNA